MKTYTAARIIEYIKEKRQARVKDLIRLLGISNVAVHKQLKKLISEGLLQKAGKPPLVFYTLSEKLDSNQEKTTFPKTIKDTIENNFLSITPDGRLLYGVEGFIYWANIYQKSKNLSVLGKIYQNAIRQKKQYTAKDGWIDATQKLTFAFKKTSIDRLLFQDIYSYPVFGRTKLAKLVMYAKQTENKILIDQIASTSMPMIEKIIKEFDISAIGFIPPTIPRRIQFIDELETRLNISLPKIDLVKIMSGDVLVPQKTLAKLEERVINARTSIYLKHTTEPSYANVLLIDDVAGSGASFNETASKLNASKIGNKKIVAFAIVGNIKGYDVIRQM